MDRPELTITEHQHSHLLQDDTCCLVDGSTDTPVPTRIPNEGPRQHGHHDHTHGTIAHQGEGGQANEEQYAREYIEETHQDKQHRGCPEGAEEIFRLCQQRET